MKTFKFIHCKLTVCHSDDQKSKCNMGCQEEGNESRRKRSIRDEYRADLYLGPIKITDEQDKGERPFVDSKTSITFLKLLTMLF